MTASYAVHALAIQAKGNNTIYQGKKIFVLFGNCYAIGGHDAPRVTSKLIKLRVG